MEDLKAAIRYVRKNAEGLRVDPEKVIAGGTSAGASTSLFLGYA